ncbi:SDR family NAD(P)-dependent oxidoreductase, partial [Arthrospira platensis SPKY1]|nr:SDR family NAD(P)-dependent oxidoreductase [Arthrospira platensis SPKY1]
AVITGGSRGFGEVLVKTFSQNGWCVAYSGRNVSTMSSETVVAQQADTANACDMKSFFSKVVQKWQRIDTLIINAGKNLDALFLKTSGQDIDAVCETNLKGFYVAVHGVL